MRVRGFAAAASLLLALVAVRAQAQASFQGLGSLPGAIPGSVAADLSADGQVVVGSCAFGATCTEAWRWTEAGGIQGLGFLPGESVSGASGTSSDGAVVYGGSEDSIFRWTPASMVDIGAGIPSGPNLQVMPGGLSSDGLVAIGGFFDFGTLLGGAFRWTSGVGVEILVPFGLPTVTTFDGLSSDGAVIVGSVGIPDDPAPFFRTDAGGTTFLPELPFSLQCQCGSIAFGVSEDGQTIVGTSHTHAFRWTAATGTMSLGPPDSPDFNDFDAALDVSTDGSVVVGWREGVPETAFVWTEGTGILDLRALLSQLGVDMTGWTLTRSIAISSDGKVIAGNGINPSGDEEAWIANIPGIAIVPALGPGGALLLGALLVVLGHRCRS